MARPPPKSFQTLVYLSAHNTPLTSSLSLSNRNHPPTQNLTHIFLLNDLAAHRHLTCPTTLPPATCLELIFQQNSFFPKKASFFLFFYGFSYLYSYTGCLAHQIQKNNDNFYLTQNVKLLIRRFLFDVPFLSFFRDSCLLFPTYHYLPHTYL